MSEELEPKKIVLTAVVKDETKNLAQFLKGLLPVISYYVIIDTGSTDGTQEMIRDMMGSIPGEIHERPFEYLGKHRQEAIELAWGKGDYLITSLDADEEFQTAPGFHSGLLTHDVYNVNKHHANLVYRVPCLVQMKGESCIYLDEEGNTKYRAQWKEPVHSYFAVEGEIAYTDDVWIISHPQSGSRSHGKTNEEKFLRDAKLLEKELKKNPNHPRNQFYLAQSYRDAGKPAKAAKEYKKRIKMGGFAEEVYISMLMNARCSAIANNRFEWEELVKAHTFRPTRIEALYDMVRYCRVNQFHWMGYIIGRGALTIPYPSEDVLFLEKDCWDWKLEDEFSLCAHGVGRHDEAILACQRALRFPGIPENERKRMANNISEIKKVAKK